MLRILAFYCCFGWFGGMDEPPFWRDALWLLNPQYSAARLACTLVFSLWGSCECWLVEAYPTALLGPWTLAFVVFKVELFWAVAPCLISCLDLKHIFALKFAEAAALVEPPIIECPIWDSFELNWGIFGSFLEAWITDGLVIFTLAFGLYCCFLELPMIWLDCSWCCPTSMNGFLWFRSAWASLDRQPICLTCLNYPGAASIEAAWPRF